MFLIVHGKILIQPTRALGSFGNFFEANFFQPKYVGSCTKIAILVEADYCPALSVTMLCQKTNRITGRKRNFTRKIMCETGGDGAKTWEVVGKFSPNQSSCRKSMLYNSDCDLSCVVCSVKAWRNAICINGTIFFCSTSMVPFIVMILALGWIIKSCIIFYWSNDISGFHNLDTFVCPLWVEKIPFIVIITLGWIIKFVL